LAGLSACELRSAAAAWLLLREDHLMSSDRSEEGIQAANYLHEEHFESHRGAVLWEPGVVVIFGNDGYSQDERTRKEVELVREKLRAAKIKEIGFGTDTAEGGYTWALLVEVDDDKYQTEAGQKLHRVMLTNSFFDLVWDAWSVAYPTGDRQDDDDFKQAQKMIAAGKYDLD
jgi:hypothetical protein